MVEIGIRVECSKHTSCVQGFMFEEFERFIKFETVTYTSLIIYFPELISKIILFQ